MVEPDPTGVSEQEWREATASCHELRVARVIEEIHDSRSLVLEIPGELEVAFRYRA